MLDKSGLSKREIWTVAASVVFALLLTMLGLWTWLWPSTLNPITAAYQEACARNPYLFSWSNHVVPLLPAFLTILILSSLIPAVWTLWRQLAMAKRVASIVRDNACPMPRKLIDTAEPLGILDYVVCVEDDRLYAFCQGIRDPHICVSTGLVRRLSSQELTAVLLHESCHMANRDPVKLLATRVTASALQMIPVVDELRQRYQLARELDADNVAVEGTSLVTLANALLKVFTSDQNWSELAYAPVGALSIAKERIVRLAGGENDKMPPIARMSIFSSLLVAIALFLSTFGFVEGSAYWASQAHGCSPTMANSKTTMSTIESGVTRCDHLGNYQSKPLSG